MRAFCKMALCIMAAVDPIWLWIRYTVVNRVVHICV